MFGSTCGSNTTHSQNGLLVYNIWVKVRSPYDMWTWSGLLTESPQLTIEANSWTQKKEGNPALAYIPHNALIPSSGDMLSEELKFCLLWLYMWLLVLMTL